MDYDISLSTWIDLCWLTNTRSSIYCKHGLGYSFVSFPSILALLHRFFELLPLASSLWLYANIVEQCAINPQSFFFHFTLLIHTLTLTNTYSLFPSIYTNITIQCLQPCVFSSVRRSNISFQFVIEQEKVRTYFLMNQIILYYENG